MSTGTSYHTLWNFSNLYFAVVAGGGRFPNNNEVQFGEYGQPSYTEAEANRWQSVDATHAIIHLPDGGKVEMLRIDNPVAQFPGDYAWVSISVTDPHGLIYTIEHNYLNGPRKITDPSGRWIEYDYVTGGYDERNQLPVMARGSNGVWAQYFWSNNQLMAVEYSDGTRADYTYYSSYFSTRSSMWYSAYLPNTMRDTRAQHSMRNVQFGEYTDWSEDPSVFPVVTTERNPDANVMVSSRVVTWAPPVTPQRNMKEVRGDGAERSFVFKEVNIDEGDLSLVEETDFRGNTRKFEYDYWRRKTKETDALNRVTLFAYEDTLGKLLRTTFPDGSYEEVTYNDPASPYFVTSKRSPRGYVTTYNLFPNGTIGQTNYPDGSNEGWGYNGFNQPTIHRFRNGAHEWMEYDGAGRLTRRSVPSFGSAVYWTNYTYYPDGHVWEDRVQTVTDPRGNITTYEYDLAFANGVQGTTPCPGRGLVTKITNHDGTYKSFGYDVYGNKIWEENELRQRTSHTYDDYNRLLTGTDPLNRTTTYQYQHSGFSENPATHTFNRPRYIYAPSGKRNAFLYDANFQMTSRTLGDGTGDASTTSYAYNTVGNQSSATDPLGRVTSFTYDSRDRKIRQDAPLGRVTQWEYDYAGNNTEVINPDGTSTRKEYDSMNRVTHAYDERNQLTRYEYWSSGKVHNIIDPRGYYYAHDYDASDRLVACWYPNASGSGSWDSNEEWNYDAAGNVAHYKNRSNQWKHYSYDSRNRETTRWWDNYAAPQVWTSYDAASRVSQKSNWHGVQTYALDAAGQVTSETQKIYGPTNTEDGRTETVSYSYDADGNQTSFGASGWWLGYLYNARQQRTAIQFGGGYDWTLFWYNGAGERTHRVHANYTWSESGYDGAGRLTLLHHYRSANGSGNDWTSIYKQQFDYDVRDRRTWVMRDDQWGDTYRYQDDSQLFEQRFNVWRPDQNFWNVAAFTDTFAYDASGNRTSVNENGAVTSYSTDALNQYTGVSGLTIQHGDGRGNITQLGGWSLTYDAENRLVHAVGPGHDIWPCYDANGRLAKIYDNGVLEYRFYDGAQQFRRVRQDGSWIDGTVWGTTPDEVVSRYVPGEDWRFHNLDPLNSAVAVTDMGRNVVERYLYDAFGAVDIRDGSWNARSSSAIGNRLLFTGQEWWPEFGLYNYKARFYSPALGRFVQHDPIRFDAGDLNLYRYCFNDSINRSDPDGKLVWFAVMAIGAVIGGGIDLGAQLYANGGNLGDVSWGRVGIAAAAGSLGGGLGSAIAAAPVAATAAGAAVRVGAAVAGNAMISSGAQVANNAIDPSKPELGKGVVRAAVVGGSLGLGGSVASTVVNGVGNAVVKAGAQASAAAAPTSRASLLAISGTLTPPKEVSQVLVNAAAAATDSALSGSDPAITAAAERPQETQPPTP